jgi:hypothetical protein
MKTTKPLQRKTPLRATTIRASKRRPARPKMTPARANARGQRCTLWLPGCKDDTDTVVLCHLRQFGGGGMGTKPHDSEGVFACAHCHDVLDGRKNLTPELRGEMNDGVLLWALIQTLRAQREAGVLIYKGEQA